MDVELAAGAQLEGGHARGLEGGAELSIGAQGRDVRLEPAAIEHADAIEDEGLGAAGGEAIGEKEDPDLHGSRGSLIFGDRPTVKERKEAKRG
ncbi:MAG: hypothetical protein R3F14_02565 [Polyangiaceae bacterium]